MTNVSLDDPNLASKIGQDKDQPAPVIERPALQHISDKAKSPFYSAILPTGYLDEESNLHKEIEIKELSGVEEDILTSRGGLPWYARMHKLMENCIVSIGDYSQTSLKWKDIIKSLIVSDHYYSMLHIRIASLGSMYTAKTKCHNPSCGHPMNKTVDLKDFLITGLADPLKRTYDGETPSGIKFVCKPQDGYQDAKMNKNKSKDILTLLILGRLVQLGDDSIITVPKVKSLSMKDRQYLRSFFNRIEGDIDNKMECVCDECGEEFEEAVDVSTPSFFFPMET